MCTRQSQILKTSQFFAVFNKGQESITKVGNAWIAICRIDPSFTSIMRTCRVPLSPSLTSSTAACWRQENLNECECCWVLAGAACCTALLPKPLPLPLLCHHNCHWLIIASFLLLLFVCLWCCCTLTNALMSLPLHHHFCWLLHHNIANTTLFWMLHQKCYWCSCCYWLMLSNHHHPLILASFFVCSCGDCILANTAATALDVAVCTALLGMPLVLLLNAVVHFYQLIVAY